MEPPGHRDVGWSILWALARAQLRMGSSVVLDGVARQPEVEGTRLVAREEGAESLVVMTTCRDVDTRRPRRGAPDTRHHQLVEPDWDHVSGSRSSWTVPGDVDLVLEAADRVKGRRNRFAALAAGRRPDPPPTGRRPARAAPVVSYHDREDARLLRSRGVVRRGGPMGDRGIGIIERFFECLSAHDWASLTAVLAPDVDGSAPRRSCRRASSLPRPPGRSRSPDYRNDVHRVTYGPDGRSTFAGHGAPGLSGRGVPSPGGLLVPYRRDGRGVARGGVLADPAHGSRHRIGPERGQRRHEHRAQHRRRYRSAMTPAGVGANPHEPT